MKHILFVEFWNCSPHLETTLEIIKRHTDQGDRVTFYFCGHDTLYVDGVSVKPADCGLFRKLPEVLGVELIGSELLEFHGRVKMPEVSPYIPSKFESLEDLISYSYGTFQAGIGVASSLVSDTKSSRPDLVANHQNIAKLIRSSVSVYEFTKSILKSKIFDRVYVFNGRFCNHRAVMCAAAEEKVELMFHERGANKYLYDVLSHAPHDLNALQRKIIANWDQNKENAASLEIARSFYDERRAGVTQAWLSYTEKQQRDLLPNIILGNKVITFFSSSEDEFVSVGDLVKFVGWDSQFSAVGDLIDICTKDQNTQLFIRLHPNKQNKSIEDQNRWLSLGQYKNVTVISFDSEIDTYALIEKSDLVVTCGSTVGIEATFWGRPSISLGPSAYADLNVCYHPQNRLELQSLIKADLAPLPKQGALAFGHYMMTFGIRYKHYDPETLFGGKFLGVNLHKLPLKRKAWLQFKQMALKPYRALRKIL